MLYKYVVEYKYVVKSYLSKNLCLSWSGYMILETNKAILEEFYISPCSQLLI